MGNSQRANWDAVQAITLAFLANIPDEAYHQRPFSGRFRTFAWEYACLLTTREMYINGYASGVLNGETFQSSEQDCAALSRVEMTQKLQETDAAIRPIITGEPTEIEYFGERASTHDVISYLLQHEQLHFGKLILMCAQAGIPIPQPLKDMWGRMSFAPKSPVV